MSDKKPTINATDDELRAAAEKTLRDQGRDPEDLFEKINVDALINLTRQVLKEIGGS